MNEFYSIAKENTEPENKYQLANLGKQTPSITIGSAKRDGYGGRSYESSTFYKTVTSEDYDGKFAFELSRIKPPYELEYMIDYHMNFYVTKQKGNREKFIKQIKYVVVPIMQKNKYSEVHIQLVNEWIKKNDNTMEDSHKVQNVITNNINGNNNPVNIAAGATVVLKDINISFSETEYNQLKELGVKEEEIQELKTIVQTEDKATLKGKAMKWLGSVSASVAAKGLYDNIPAITDFIHRLL